MTKKTLFLLCLISVSLSAFSQVVISSAPGEQPELFTAKKRIVFDTCQLQIQYRMYSITDIKKGKKEHNFMLLQIGNRISKFSDYFRIKEDSLADLYEKQKMESTAAMNKLMPYRMSSLAMIILKNTPKDKITTCDYMPMGGYYKFSEMKQKPNWKLLNETVKICGYDCKKATATFRGRNYTAWYAPKIPISDGPWKFWGLPGMILKVEDDKQEYSFEAVGIEKLRRIDKIYILDLDYFTTTKERFYQGVKNYYDNPNPFIESKAVTVDGKPLKLKSRPYNPIELSE